MSCGNYGRRSADGRIRSYTRNECEDGLDGIFGGGGECGKKEGGSWSWECRFLNSLPDSDPAPEPRPPKYTPSAVTTVAEPEAPSSSAMPSPLLLLGVAAVALLFMKR